MNDCDTCAKCRFWRMAGTRAFGNCYRYPPQLFVVGDDVRAGNPLTSADDFGGEFQPKETPIGDDGLP